MVESKLSSQHGLGAAQQAGKVNEWLVAKLAEKLEIESHEIDIDTDFLDYGLSSLETVNLSGDLERFLGRRLSPTLFLDYPNIKTLAQYFAKEANTNGVSSKGHALNGTRNGCNDIKSDLQSVQPLPTESNSHDIPPEYWRFDCHPGYLQLQEQRSQLNALGSESPLFIPQERVVNATTLIGNQEFLNYATYNYLGMSGDAKVSEATKAAIDRYGTSASASRLLSGEKPLHRELEAAISELLGTEDSIVLVGGHATNVTTIGHLFGSEDLILYDALSHNSILQGCYTSGASLVVFPHNDWQALDRELSARRHQHQRILVVIEGVYSTDGDIPDLPRFIEVKQRHKAFLMVDEAHSIGVLGSQGRGIGEHFGVNPADVDLWMGTLSKSFASCGGYISGCKAVVDYLKHTAPGFVFSVGISPPNAASALAAIQQLKAEPERVSRLHARSQLFSQLAKERGIDTGRSGSSPVVPVIIGDSFQSVQLSRNLFQRGINVPFMIYPSVPQHEARLRFFISCNHTEVQIRHTVDILAEEVARIRQSSVEPADR